MTPGGGSLGLLNFEKFAGKLKDFLELKIIFQTVSCPLI
jgi:hypothetical protein